jgi:hypothetical protein
MALHAELFRIRPCVKVIGALHHFRLPWGGSFRFDMVFLREYKELPAHSIRSCLFCWVNLKISNCHFSQRILSDVNILEMSL